MLGVRADYELGKDAVIGGTFMQLFERPFTQKVNFGDDPINNRVYGLDFSMQKNAQKMQVLMKVEAFQKPS